jgi:hypothetical protein
MNIIGFIGSPRKTGSTAWTVNKILDGAREQSALLGAPANTQVFNAGALNLKPCQEGRKRRKEAYSCVDTGQPGRRKVQGVSGLYKADVRNVGIRRSGRGSRDRNEGERGE